MLTEKINECGNGEEVWVTNTSPKMCYGVEEGAFLRLDSRCRANVPAAMPLCQPFSISLGENQRRQNSFGSYNLEVRDVEEKQSKSGTQSLT